MGAIIRYAFGWRILHWVIALLVLSTIPIGLTMASRAEAGIFDTLTNTFYAAHKTIGFTILILTIARIATRIRIGTPPYPRSMSRALVVAAKTLHYFLYILLVVVPLLGWAGVTAYPALIIAGPVSLPPLPFVPVDQDLAETIFAIHGFAAITLGVLVIGHIGAALRHLLIVRDGVFQRMWFTK